MKALIIAVSALALLATTGCSTIIKGKDQVVTINSNVEDAQITVNGVPVGKTPFTGPILRNSKTVVGVSKDGYVTKNVTLDTSIEPIFWGNIIIGGVLGSTTDASTGSMYKYAPATIQIDLEKKSS